ncbi:MAG: hypothetical protein ACE1ZA_03965 [Pseudomonadales bacterium]
MIIPVVVSNSTANGSYRKKDKSHDEALIAELLERCGGEMRKNTLVATHGDYEFHLRFDARDGTFHLIIPCVHAGRFKLRRKNFLDRTLATVVPAWPLRSHDPRFDETYSIGTRDHRLTEDVICQRPVRDAVNKLMGYRVSGIHLEGDRVRATGSRKRIGSIDTERVFTMVEKLGTIARAVSRWATTHERRPAPKRDRAVLVVSTILALLTVAGFVMMFIAIASFAVVDAPYFVGIALLTSLAAVLLMIVPVTLALSRRTSPYNLVFRFVVIKTLVLTLFVSSSLLLTNGFFDAGARTTQVDPICCKRLRQNSDDRKKNKTRHYAGVVKDDTVNWYRVYEAAYNAIEEGRTQLSITTAPGLLGFEWRVGHRVVQP